MATANKLIQLKDNNGNSLFPKILAGSIPAASITNDKLASALQTAISQVSTNSNRITALESAGLNPKTTVTCTSASTQEYKLSSITIGFSIALSTSKGNASDFTDTKIFYNDPSNLTTSSGGASSQTEHLVNGTSASQSYTINGVGNYTLSASGTGKYKGTAITYPSASATYHIVVASYIGYIDDIKNFSSALSTHFTKKVQTSMSGSYDVTNNYSAPAYMVIAIPKNGNVSGVNKIVQHGTLDAVQQFTKDTTTSTTYDFYICNTKHNAGTYNFIIS